MRLAALVLLALLTPGSRAQTGELGKSAYAHTKALVELGPRPPGSPAHAKMRTYIQNTLKSAKLTPEVDTFTAQTPQGKQEMYNISARIAGKSSRAVMITGHYDTKWMPAIRFVGANDGGSSAGLLLALAHKLAAGPPHELSVWICFLDGEESTPEEWDTEFALYGSKQMAKQLKATGKASQVAAVINIDMIGDKNLNILRDVNSTGWLNTLVRDVAKDLGLSSAFGSLNDNMTDDHLPFLAIGLPAIDLIDFDYGPNRIGYWHNEKDALDKLSAESLDTVGRIVIGSIDAIAKRK